MNNLTISETLADAVNAVAEKVIKKKRYAAHNCEVVFTRSDIYLKYKHQRIGSFQIFKNQIVKYQHEIPTHIPKQTKKQSYVCI